MLRAKRTTLGVMAIPTACFVAAIAYAAPSATEAYAANSSLERHALPVTEPSLETDLEKLEGTDLMSGISGSLFPHEIDIPGTQKRLLRERAMKTRV